MTPHTRRAIERNRILLAAQRRRSDLARWTESVERIASIKPRSDDEAVAKHECLTLLEQARPR
jgi:hypothetical protein